MKTALALICSTLLMACTSSLQSESRAAESPQAQASVQQVSIDKAYTHLAGLAGISDEIALHRRFVLLKSERDKFGLQHLFFGQHHLSIEILNAELIVHLRDDQVYRVDGEVLDLAGPPESSEPRISAGTAVRAVLQIDNKLKAEHLARSTLHWLKQDNNRLRLVYLLDMRAGLTRNFYLVDAHTGAFIKMLNGMPSSAG